MARSNEHVPITCEVSKTTPKAVLIKQQHANHARSYWIPRSLIEDGDFVDESEGITEIGIEEWFVEQEGIDP